MNNPPPRTDTVHKVARVASIIFMGLAWFTLVAAFFWCVHQWDFNSKSADLTIVSIILIALIAIPIKILHYLKEKH